MSSCNCDTCLVRVVLVRALLTHHSYVANILSFIKGNIVKLDYLKGTLSFNPFAFWGPRFLYQFLDTIYLTHSNMRSPKFLLMLGVVGVDCTLIYCPIPRPKWVGIPEPVDMVYTSWVAPLVATPVGPSCVGHRCGGPLDVWAQKVAAPSPLKLVAVLRWQVFSPLDLASATLEVGSHPTFPSW